MSIAARVNGGITRLAVGRHLPERTVRLQLTLLYGGLFLLSGAALMAISYALLVNAGFIFSLQNGTQPLTGRPASLAPTGPPGVPGPGSGTYPSAQTMAHWREVAQCMRQHGVSGFPDPTTSVPSNFLPAGGGEESDRDGAILVIPSAVERSPQFTQAATACGLIADQPAAEDYRRTQVRQELLLQSGIALAGMSLLPLVLGWLMAGRVLQPLEDSYQAQRQFVANASHELRAPLTRLRALSEVALANSEANFASLRAAHERILASEQYLEQLIDGLLALTRGQAGLERREHLDLATITSQALHVHESQLAGLDLDVRATLATAPATGDPRLVERLIANLIDNAIRHNTPHGHIDIATGTRDRRAFVSIANTGPDVPPDEVERLFQPFQRLDGARTRHNNGHGLGLSIVKAIASAHGAQLSARARPQGGLSIDVSFPPPSGPGATKTLAAASTKRDSPRTGRSPRLTLPRH